MKLLKFLCKLSVTEIKAFHFKVFKKTFQVFSTSMDVLITGNN